MATSTLQDLGRGLRQLRAQARPIPFASRGTSIFSGVFSRSNPEAQMETMTSIGSVFSIVDAIATEVAGVEWHLYRKRRPGSDPNSPRVEVFNHAVKDLIERPNQFFTWQELVETGQQHEDLTGERWLVVARDRRSSLPMELWPVRPDRMRIVPSPSEFIQGYIYVGPNGEQVPLDVNEVIFIRRPSPLDPYRGLGPVQTVLTDIDASRYSAEWNRNFFLNSAEPGGIIQFKTKLSDTEWRKFRARWGEQHQGVTQAHRVAMLEGGAEWVDRKFTMRDMQFAELRNVNDEIIRRAFRFPKSMRGDSETINRATATADAIMFGRRIAKPRLGRLRAAINNDLIPMFYPKGVEPDIEYDFESPVPEDEEAENAARESKARAFQAYLSIGMDPEWAAEVCELPAPPSDVNAAGTTRQLSVVEAAQKVYLGVDVVYSADEAREMLNRLGADLPTPWSGHIPRTGTGVGGHLHNGVGYCPSCGMQPW